MFRRVAVAAVSLPACALALALGDQGIRISFWLVLNAAMLLSGGEPVPYIAHPMP